MKKFLLGFLAFVILCPTISMDAGLLLGIFTVPLAIIIVFVANGVEIHRALHKDDNKEK